MEINVLKGTNFYKKVFALARRGPVKLWTGDKVQAYDKKNIKAFRTKYELYTTLGGSKVVIFSFTKQTFQFNDSDNII